MTTLVFFFIGWGLLFVLLLLLPSIFDRKVTAILAGIAGLLALIVIGTEMFVSWQTAVGAGLLLTVITSFLAAKRVDILDEEDESEPVPKLYEPVTRHDPQSDRVTDDALGRNADWKAPPEDLTNRGQEAEETAGSDTEMADATEMSEPESGIAEQTDEEGTFDEPEAPEPDKPEYGSESSVSNGEDETPDEGNDGMPKRFMVGGDEDEESDDAGEADDEAEASRLMHQEEDSSLTERRPLNEEDDEPIMRRSSSIDVEEFSGEEADEERPAGTPESEGVETPAVTDPHDVNEKRKRVFESLADDDEAGGRDK